MIKLENVEIGMDVLIKDVGKGVIRDLWVSDANNVYAVVELSCNHKVSFPLSKMTKLNN